MDQRKIKIKLNMDIYYPIDGRIKKYLKNQELEIEINRDGLAKDLFWRDLIKNSIIDNSITLIDVVDSDNDTNRRKK